MLLIALCASCSGQTVASSRVTVDTPRVTSSHQAIAPTGTPLAFDQCVKLVLGKLEQEPDNPNHYAARLPIGLQRLGLLLADEEKAEVYVGGERLLPGGRWLSPPLHEGRNSFEVAIVQGGKRDVYLLDARREWRTTILNHASSSLAFDGALAMTADGGTLLTGGWVKSDLDCFGDSEDLPASCSEHSDSGGVSTFVRRRGQWELAGTLSSQEEQAGVNFGVSLAVSDDANVFAAGAKEVHQTPGTPARPGMESAGTPGQVTLFARDRAGWHRRAKLSATNKTNGDGFNHVALSGSGKTLVVGASGQDGLAETQDRAAAKDESTSLLKDSGVVYVFSAAEEGWLPAARIEPSSRAAGNHFGSAVALSRNGRRVVVGAPSCSGRTIPANGTGKENSLSHAGTAYVFVNTGDLWLQEAQLMASDAAESDFFGSHVAISGDSKTIAVITNFKGHLVASGWRDDGGQLYIFRLGERGWLQEAMIMPTTAPEREGIQGPLALSADGNTLAFTANIADRPDGKWLRAGSVRLMHRDDGRWHLGVRLTAPQPDYEDRFGWGLAMSADGTSLAARSYLRDPSGAMYSSGITRSGVIYVFDALGAGE